MEDLRWLLKFDFKTGWKWHALTFILLIVILWMFLTYALGYIETYLENPIFAGDVLYIIGYSGALSLFCFRENVNPKRLGLNDYYVPMIRLIREMPISPTKIAHFYLLKTIYMNTLLAIFIGFMMYPIWVDIFTVTDYIAFILFCMGIGYILGFVSLILHPMRHYMVATIMVIILVFLTMIVGSILTATVFDNSLLGFVIEHIKNDGLVVPIISMTGAALAYYPSKRAMVSVIERRDFT